MPERICENCGEHKTPVMLCVSTFGGDDQYIETNKYECRPCNINELKDLVQSWRNEATLLYEQNEKLKQKIEELTGEPYDEQ